jgi:hypothetical protein
VLIRGGCLALVIAAAAMVGARAWASRPQVAPTAPTAASFSLDVGAPRGGAAAAQLVARLHDAGIAAYARPAGTRSVEQVMAGPYVSLDEAEAVQRRLRNSGFGGASLFVDDSLRRAPRNEAVPETLGSPGVVLVGAPGRLSVALEMRSQPRLVTTNRVDSATLHVDIGPVDEAVEPQTWNAPAGVHLIRGVGVEKIADGAPSYVRATLIVPEFARANTRIEGRRVYVDLTWPDEGRVTPSRPRTVPPAVSAPSVAPSRSGQATVAEAAPDLDAFAARIERLRPFVESAARQPSPEVVAALRPMVDELITSLRQVVVLEEDALRHAQLSAEVARARGVLQALTN